MNAPFDPAPYPIRRLPGVCPFCNEACAELWLDPARQDMSHQARCALCGACGPWGSEDGAAEAWASVKPILNDEDP